MKPFDLNEKKDNPVPPAPQHLGDIREKYTIKTEKVENRPGCWDSTKVVVLKFGEPIYEYYFCRTCYDEALEEANEYVIYSLKI